MHIPRLICATDGIEMLISKTGEIVEMVASWGPYYKVAGDTFECPNCKHLVTLLANKAIAEHFEGTYPAITATRKADLHNG
jgi:hypothetical protein